MSGVHETTEGTENTERGARKAASVSSVYSVVTKLPISVARAIASPIVSIELAAAFRRKRFLVAFTLALLVVVAILITVVAYNVTERPSRVGQYIFIAFSATL